MKTFTLRVSEDRSIYFIEPGQGKNARGFWLGVEKFEYPVPVEAIKNPYSGAIPFDGYWRRWFSMRGFIVRQGAPQSGVPASAELVRDYFAEVYPVTLEEAQANAWFEQYAARVAEQAARRAAVLEKTEAPERAVNTEKSATVERAAKTEETERTERTDPEGAAGFSSGGRPPKHDDRKKKR
jgi:hypothetical protein